MIQISIPVEPHVKKYLMKKYGSTYTASKTSFLGLEVLQALSGEYEKPYVPSEQAAELKHSYKVFIPERYFNSNGHTVSINNLQHLGEVVTKNFMETMCQYLDMMVDQGKLAMPELRTFLHYYHISEEDVKLESLYKTYQRHCKGSIKSPKIAV
ncbi:hypothetical protein R1T16_05685 [Flavobacterium sp. DG1-102-2]|uniref:hypothetical protein n=1 Tax=Flavobacterium sp. DG1-102-2 TaxID=3081663 RepID=UPI0029494481|nr:hypothetical protein [Flavobacterium sp. DG1-102-2]MDV6167907.1 hypothetical protein [Flavobacterium sp. DG1-102-2]